MQALPTSPRRALIVIDVQQEYFENGGLPIVHPPVESSLAQLLRAMDAARDAGVPVVVVQHDQSPGDPVFASGSELWRLHPDVAARPSDFRVNKRMPSVFTGTALADWLKARDIDTLTIVGYMTQNCNASTVFEAYHTGFSVEVLSDASGALPYLNDAGAASAEEIHRVFSVVFHSNFAAVATTDAWREALRTGQPLPKDNVLASNQRARQHMA